MMALKGSSRSLLLVIFAGFAGCSLVATEGAAPGTIEQLEEKPSNQRARVIRKAQLAAELEFNAAAGTETGYSDEMHSSGQRKHASDDEQEQTRHVHGHRHHNQKRSPSPAPLREEMTPAEIIEEKAHEQARKDTCQVVPPSQCENPSPVEIDASLFPSADNCLYTIKSGLETTEIGSDRFCTTICESDGYRIKCQGAQAGDVVAKFRFYVADSTLGKYRVQAHDGHFCKVVPNENYKVACNVCRETDGSIFTLYAVGGNVFRMKFGNQYCWANHHNSDTSTYFVCNKDQEERDDDQDMFIETYTGTDDAGPTCPFS